MLSRKRLIKIALESPSGTKAAGTVAVLTEDLDIKPTAPFESRKGGGLYLGNTVPGILGERTGTCSFTVELRSTAGVTFTMPKVQYKELTLGDREGLMIYDATGQCNISSGDDFLTIAKGAGTLGSGLDELFKSSGYKLTSTTYGPHSVLTDQQTLSIDVWEDGKKKGLAGAQGKWTLEGEYGKRVLLKFEYTGVWQAPVDEAMPAFAPGTTAPLRLAGGTFTIATAAKKISKITIDPGQQVVPRPDVNATGGVAFYSITDFEPTVNFDLESQLVAAYDINGIWLAGTEAAVVLAAA